MATIHEPDADGIPYQPSSRALAALDRGKAWDLMKKVGQLPAYDSQTCPDGVINLSGALNTIMRDWFKEYTENNLKRFPINEVLSYGTIFGGPKLLESMAGFFNAFFNPSSQVEPSHIIATNGVTAMIDLVAWTLCEPGDAILFPAPTFYMLDYDLDIRNGVVSVPVGTSAIGDPFGNDEQSIRDLIRILDDSASAAEARGNRPRVLFICNPANPQGQSYSAEALAALANFCARRQTHLVADEIYALSQFGPSKFASVLGIDEKQVGTDEIKQMVHCIYGLSKDFDMGGVRMGFLVSRNEAFIAAIKRVTWFTWITKFSEVFVADFFGRPDMVQNYVTLYQQRLGYAYRAASNALTRNSIPFRPAQSGLFVLIDLWEWIHHFRGPDQAPDPSDTREGQLCNYLVGRGVFINPGQFAFCDRPGQFRLVFTEVPSDVVVLAIDWMRDALDELSSVTHRVSYASEDPTTLADSTSVSSIDTRKATPNVGTEPPRGRNGFRGLMRKFNCIK